MNNEEVKSKLKAFFMSDLGVDGDVLNYDTPLFGEEIGLDSVDSLEIISFVDSNFGVSMTGAGKEPSRALIRSLISSKSTKLNRFVLFLLVFG